MLRGQRAGANIALSQTTIFKTLSDKKMTIQKKLWLMIGLAVLAILIVAGTILLSKHDRMLEDRKRATRVAVETAWGIMESLDKIRFNRANHT